MTVVFKQKDGDNVKRSLLIMNPASIEARTHYGDDVLIVTRQCGDHVMITTKEDSNPNGILMDIARSAANGDLLEFVVDHWTVTRNNED